MQEKKKNMPPETLALNIAETLDAQLARDIRLFNVQGVSSFTDFVLIATATSAPHLKALAADLRSELKKSNVDCYRISGTPESGWLVADYIDVVVHIFSPDARKFYDLEGLMTTAKELQLPQS